MKGRKEEMTKAEEEMAHIKADKVYLEIINLSREVIKLFPMRFREFEYFDYRDEGKVTEYQKKYYNHSWAPSKSEFRNDKIEKILV